MTKDETLKLALQLISNLRTHSWTVADEQLVITAIKEALAQQNEFKPDWDEKLALTEEVIRLSKRTWIGLTKKEFQEAVEGLEDLEDCWVAIESALRSKNHG